MGKRLADEARRGRIPFLGIRPMNNEARRPFTPKPSGRQVFWLCPALARSASRTRGTGMFRWPVRLGPPPWPNPKPLAAAPRTIIRQALRFAAAIRPARCINSAAELHRSGRTLFSGAIFYAELPFRPILHPFSIFSSGYPSIFMAPLVLWLACRVHLKLWRESASATIPDARSGRRERAA